LSKTSQRRIIRVHLPLIYPPLSATHPDEITKLTISVTPAIALPYLLCCITFNLDLDLGYLIKYVIVYKSSRKS
jgi:hypothetical protein